MRVYLRFEGHCSSIVGNGGKLTAKEVNFSENSLTNAGTLLRYVPVECSQTQAVGKQKANQGTGLQQLEEIINKIT